MEFHNSSWVSELLGRLASFTRRCIFRVLSVGPIPSHLSFIMDGNRRFAKRVNLEAGGGHRAGFLAVMSLLKYCYELGVKYVTIFAFSIDNFNRRPDEIQIVMDLMLEKIEGLLKVESIVHQYGIRIYFIGDLKLLNERIRVAAEKVMKVTANNTKCALLICVAYTSTNEITHAVKESCKDKWKKVKQSNSDKDPNGVIEEVEGGKMIDNAIQESCNAVKGSLVYNGSSTGVKIIGSGCRVTVNAIQGLSGDKQDGGEALGETRTCNGGIPDEESEKIQSHSFIKLIDIEKHMHMAVAPDPDTLIRTSGETRLSNFMLWQTSNCTLYSPDALWPEIGLWHLIWTVLNFQRNHSYLEKKKKQV